MNINENLKQYIDSIFREAPQNSRTIELKEEMLINLTEKFYDLLNEGNNEETAFKIAIESVGDISELIESLKKDTKSTNLFFDMKQYQDYQIKSALCVATAIVLYILSLVPLIVVRNIIGLILMFFIIAMATALLVYNNMTNVTFIKLNHKLFNEMVGDRRNMLRKGPTIGILWILLTIIYFALSFTTMAWHITWMIFLMGAVITLVFVYYIK